MLVPLKQICGLVFVIFLDAVAPQGIFQLLTTNGLTEFHRLINSSYAMQGLLTNPLLPLTIFVPTNDAISRWRTSNRNAPINSDILQNHIAPGVWNERRLIEIAQAPIKQERRILSGFFNGPLWLRYFQSAPGRDQAKIFINNALILTERPYQIGSQIIYTVDELIAPTGTSVPAGTFIEDPSAQSYSGLWLDELRDELRQQPQVTAFQDQNQIYTFFLPNNAAFAAMKNRGAFDFSTIQGHIVPGQALFLRTFNETLSDMLQSTPGLEGFSTLLSSEPGSPECFIGYTNSTGEVQVYSESTKDTSKFAKGRVYTNIVQANIPVSNGVLHVIEKVLLLIEENAKEIIDTRQGMFKFREWFNGADPKLLERIRSQNDITVLVPTNRAISALPRNRVEMLQRDAAYLQRIISMHIIPMRLTSDFIANDTLATADDGSMLTFQVHGTGAIKVLTVEGGSVKATLLEPDVGVTNGVIHVIDSVLGIPFMNIKDKLDSEDNLQFTSRAIDQAGDLRSKLTNLGTNFTFFAPSNQAWERIPTIMKRHIIAGSMVRSDALRNHDRFYSMFGDLRILRNNTDISIKSGDRNIAKVIKADIEAINGVIHIVDKVLFERDRDIVYINSARRSCSRGVDFAVGFSAILFLVFREILRL